MDFIGKRKFSYVLSALLIIVSIISMCVQGFNFGIDFTGGTVMQVKFEKSLDIADLREDLKAAGYEGAQIQELDGGVYQIKAQYMDQNAQDKFSEKLEAETGKFDIQQANAVGPSVGQEILNSGVLALIIALVLMIVYISVRFEWRFAVAGNIALFHNIIITLGVFSLFQLEVNAQFVAAVLTIFGYSINDTLVVFDRIRERIGNVKRDDLLGVVNLGIGSVVKRSVYTSVSTLIPLFAVLFLGGATTKLFVLAIIIGIIAGTYASIFVASPLWYDISMKSKKKRF